MAETDRPSHHSGAAKPRIDVDGPGAPPRRNGELVFQAPWEGRAFGLAVALGEGGHVSWEAFRARLIRAITDSDRRAEGERSAYYESWLGALRRLLIERDVVTAAEVEQRVREFATGRRDIVNPNRGGE